MNRWRLAGSAPPLTVQGFSPRAGTMPGGGRGSGAAIFSTRRLIRKPREIQERDPLLNFPDYSPTMTRRTEI